VAWLVKRQAFDEELAGKLWQASEKLTGLKRNTKGK
jgi:hypothetical protein